MGWLNDNDGIPLDTWPSHNRGTQKPQSRNGKIVMAITIAVCLVMLIMVVFKLDNWLSS